MRIIKEKEGDFLFFYFPIDMCADLCYNRIDGLARRAVPTY